MKKVENENKNNFKLLYFSAALFYIASVISFVTGNENSLGVMWLGLGSAFLCFGSVALKKANESKEEEDKDK